MDNISKHVNTQEKWKSNVKKLPSYIPTNPQNYYSKKGWVSWSEFLGNSGGYSFLPYNEAKEWIRQSNFRGIKKKDWYKITKYLPFFIPKDPYAVYKRQGLWVGWNDFIN